MTTLQTIREAVVKAIPEILELKFGCIVKRALSEGGGELATVLGVDDTGQIAYTSWAPFHANKTSVHHDFVKHLEILGRPIQLADVLRAMGTNIDPVTQHMYSVDCIGRIWTWNADIGFPVFSGVSWNLAKNLDDQDEPTLKALAEILK